MPTCCRIRLCCPDGKAAADLAAHESIPVEAAAKIIAGYQLVPLTLEPDPGDTTAPAHVKSAQDRLAKLHRHVRGELRAILIDLGHPVDE